MQESTKMTVRSFERPGGGYRLLVRFLEVSDACTTDGQFMGDRFFRLPGEANRVEAVIIASRRRRALSRQTQGQVLLL